ncbi:hypothetical protein GCM10022281_02050 [Sphingomonas rosea]|uniref:Uncharacterized protein n=1 Tax=Sphingomonas rosea TaxID=335605 RepID=A0ABP7TJ88_9SPHN
MTADGHTPDQSENKQHLWRTAAQDNAQQRSHDRQAGSPDARQSSADDMATGQASYGNSGDTGTVDQQADNAPDSASQGGDRLFSGSSDDLGSSGQAQSSANLGTDGAQDFAADGQGASTEDPTATTDVESERSQRRDSDIEGSSL